MTKKILAIDQGTTSSRCIVFDQSGHILAQSSQEFDQIFPTTGWVEHDPEQIWSSVKSCLENVLAQHPDIDAIGITNQRETCVVWDQRTGKPIYNAIVWQDRRTSDYCDDLKKHGHKAMIQIKTGLLVDPYFSAYKLHWILQNVAHSLPSLNQQNLICGTIETFLLWRLTGGKSHKTDVTNASRTSLFNIHNLAWDPELLELFQIPTKMLPEIESNIGDFGTLDPSVVNIKISRPIPILSMIGDQQSASIGQACFEAGDVKATYGTGCFMLMNSGQYPCISTHHLLTTVAFQVQNHVNYAIEGSIFNAGSVMTWLKDKMNFISSPNEIEELCQSVKVSPARSGIYFVPALTGLGAPYWKAEARGMLSGLTRDTSKAEIVRAAVESIIYQSHDLMLAMQEDAKHDITQLKVDGGMAHNDWFLSGLSSFLNKPIIRPQVTETTSLGTALLAGLQAGIFSSIDDIKTSWQFEREFKPQKSYFKDFSKEKTLKGWKEALAKV